MHDAHTLIEEEEPMGETKEMIREVSLDQVKDAFSILGLDMMQVRSVTIGPKKVQVEEFRISESGARYVAGDDVAMLVYDVDIVGDEYE